MNITKRFIGIAVTVALLGGIAAILLIPESSEYSEQQWNEMMSYCDQLGGEGFDIKESQNGTVYYECLTPQYEKRVLNAETLPLINESNLTVKDYNLSEPHNAETTIEKFCESIVSTPYQIHEKRNGVFYTCIDQSYRQRWFNAEQLPFKDRWNNQTVDNATTQ